jgi:hypothetical protein
MPIYCYTTKDGQTVERFFPMGQAPEKIRVGRRVARRDFAAEGKGGFLPANWPMCSDAAGINPDQAVEAHAHSVKIGIPTEFNSEGQAVFTSPHHRKRYCEAIGLYDRNGGYNDPQRQKRES